MEGKNLDLFDFILLVDDDFTVNYINRHILKSVGYGNSLEITNGGEEALVFLNSKNEVLGKGIIFLDINMPRMKGWEFIMEFRKLPEGIYSNIDIYIVTTSMDPEHENVASKYPEVKGFIFKPLSRESIREIMGSYGI